MSRLLNKLLGRRDGVSAIEFAILVPLMMLVFGGVIEIGRLLGESSALEKSLQAGALIAARSSLPLSNEALQAVENTVKTGTVNGAGEFLLPGWADGGSSLSIQVTPQVVSGETVNVVRLAAAVPHIPIIQGLVDYIGLNSYILNSSHETAHIGD